MPKVTRDWDAHLPVMGEDIIPEQFYNIVMFGTTGSGKTVLINHLIRHTIDKRTTVHIFSETFTIDCVWRSIAKYMDKEEIHYIHHNSIGKGGEKLKSIMSEIKSEVRAKRDMYNMKRRAKEHKTVSVSDFMTPFCGLTLTNDPTDEDHDMRMEKKAKESVPQFLLILDDLDEHELRSLAVNNVLKKDRHYRTSAIVSTQHVVQFNKQACAQLSELVLFGGFNSHVLKQLHQRLPIKCSVKELEEFYDANCPTKHDFITFYCREIHEVRAGLQPNKGTSKPKKPKPQPMSDSSSSSGSESD
jgi:hypothetical protein